ncbi:MAG: hypothetical protein A2X36_04250 [Elusimicrobia bacterium GWA2_69_24]|nr:MAG: hypothetical protein A2X36_04250 [Elusimicrobia bacterium GWA2_69_24]
MIDVCVSTHDNRRELPEVLDSLSPLRGALDGAVRVFDNGSTDGGPEWVRRSRPWAEVRELGANLGPAASRNAALRVPGGDWILLLDGDCALAPDCLDALLRERDAYPAEVYSPRIVYAADPGRIYYDAGAAHFLGLLCLENAHTPEAEAVRPTRVPGAVSTSALLVARNAALRAGLFDEDYFFCGEDLDFSLRLRALGGRLRHVPEAVVLHHKPLPGSEAEAAARARRSGERCRRQGPNRWRTLLKVCRAGTLLRLAPAHLAYAALEGLDALRQGGGLEYLRGLSEVLWDLPSILRARGRVQASRTTEDAVLFGAPALSWRPEVQALPGARSLKRALERLGGALWLFVAFLDGN